MEKMLDTSSFSFSNNDLKSLPISIREILDASKLQNFEDDNFQFDNKSGKLSQDTPVLPQVVKLGHAPDKIQV